MKTIEYITVTLAERPDLTDKIFELHAAGWSKFMLQDEVANQYFGYLPKLFPHLQFLLLDLEENIVACGNAVSFHWDGSIDDLPGGWDDVLRRAVKENEKGIIPNTVSAIAIVVDPSYRGKSISDIMVRKMKELVKNNNFEHMVAPVRPSLKHKYPLIPMEQYAYWKTKDGEPFDPWLRIHWRTGASILSVAHESMMIKGTVSDWEKWMEMAFPDSGQYVIPGALVPILIDSESDFGLYVEPNVWMKHRL
ncbi:hypothetical protein GCM10008967_09900 [Bacillus carboniphilus]|uniref:N-acetyltransferase domain-containing protein n=1 Tax=Bacillus carboniphilus TaxID=86663 RepID=A0ABP3FQX2_9BACI